MLAARRMLIQRALPTLTDNFNRADSTSTINPASDGGTWTVAHGTWGISSNQGYVANGVGGNGNWIARDLGSTACDFSCDIFIPVGFTQLVWMTFGGSGSDRSATGFTGYELGGIDGASTINLQQIGGAGGTIGSFSPGNWRGTTKTFRVTYNGSTFEVFFGGVSQFTATPTPSGFTGTWVHLGTSEAAGGGSARFDNFTAIPG